MLLGLAGRLLAELLPSFALEPSAASEPSVPEPSVPSEPSVPGSPIESPISPPELPAEPPSDQVPPSEPELQRPSNLPSEPAQEHVPAEQTPSPPVQQPSGPTSSKAPQPAAVSPSPPASSIPATPQARASQTPVAKPDDPPVEPESKKKYGGFKYFRFGIWPHLGYTNGTSQKNGIFDQSRTIEQAMMTGQVDPVGAGDLGKTRFGGGMYGFQVDLEAFFVNLWFDFHKFFTPGGMFSVLIGYDHEFYLHRRVHWNLGAGFGFMRIFLGKPLEKLYYDASNPMSTSIATAGIEARLITSFDFKLVGPLYTGPWLMLGYHHLFTANVEEVTKEKGIHYSFAWTLKLEFTVPPDR